MAKPRIKIPWERIIRFFRRSKRVIGLPGELNDEAPLHSDVFSEHIRLLQGPFFD